MAIIEVTASGTGDDTITLQTAIAGATTKDRIVIHGACFTSQRIAAPCVIEGDDKINSTLNVIPGSGLPSLATIVDKSGIGFRHLGFVGEDVYNTTGPGAAIALGAQSVPCFDQFVEDCAFSKFKADQWILGGSGAPVNGLRLTYLHFVSTAADVTFTGARLNGGTFINLYGQAGGFTNTKLSGLIMDGTGVAFGVTAFGNHERLIIDRFQIDNMGLNTVAGQNTHPINIYNTDASPNDVTIALGQITNPADDGVYVANASNVDTINCKITGQYRTDSVSLPRAAVAYNGVNRGLISGCNLTNNWRAIAISGGSGTPACYDISVLGNKIYNDRDSDAVGIFGDGATLALNSRFVVMGNDIWLKGGGSQAFGGVINGSGDIRCTGNTARAAVLGITGWTGASVITSPNILG